MEISHSWKMKNNPAILTDVRPYMLLRWEKYASKRKYTKDAPYY